MLPGKLKMECGTLFLRLKRSLRVRLCLSPPKLQLLSLHLKLDCPVVEPNYYEDKIVLPLRTNSRSSRSCKPK
jgi:predicted transcriptional regulator